MLSLSALMASGTFLATILHGVNAQVAMNQLNTARLQPGQQVRVAFLLRVCVASLLEATELAKPVEMPCLRCNTHMGLQGR